MLIQHTKNNPLSVRVGRIELPFSAWQADVLPLNYTRFIFVVYYIFLPNGVYTRYMESSTRIDVSNIPDSVKHVTRALEEAGYEAFCIGGCVRDLILDKYVRDWDVTTNAPPEAIESLFEHTFYENTYGTVTAVFDQEIIPEAQHVEITPYRKESTYSNSRHPDTVDFNATLEEDCKRRDFTINAISLNARTGEVFDFHKGIQDLSLGVLRTIGDPHDRFNEDALRLMRAIRIAGELHFTIEKKTLEAIKTLRHTLKDIAIERVRDEFLKMIESVSCVYSFTLFYKAGLMDVVFPEFAKGWGVEQNRAHSYDVFTHNLKTLEHATKKELPLYIKLAGFFHDIAKPHTREWSDKRNTWSFHNHEVVGAKITKDILRSLKIPHETAKKVVIMVRWHMFFSDTEKISASAVRRLLVRVGEGMLWDLIDLRMCDRVGTGRPKENPYRLRQYTALVEKVLRDPITPGNLAINGTDLMKELDIPPGKVVGSLLQILLFEFLDRPREHTREHLLARAKELKDLPPKDLEQLREEASRGIQQIENKELEYIDKKYGVH